MNAPSIKVKDAHSAFTVMGQSTLGDEALSALAALLLDLAETKKVDERANSRSRCSEERRE